MSKRVILLQRSQTRQQDWLFGVCMSNLKFLYFLPFKLITIILAAAFIHQQINNYTDPSIM